MQSNNRSLTTLKPNPLSTQSGQMLSLGRRNGWGFQHLGYAELPERPVRLQDWLLVPANQDSTPVPPRTLERIKSIYAAGYKPRGFVVVHEAPKAFQAPRPEQSATRMLPMPAVSQVISNSAPAFNASNPSGIADGLASIISAFASMIFPMLFIGLLALDPIVVAVMEDGSWIEIDRWDVPLKPSFLEA
jgi:hypothetical protein